MGQSSSNLIWIDLEMTGLDPDNDYIIEIATVVTDAQLNLIEKGPVIAVHQSDEILAGMDAWNTDQHGGSGLTKRVRQSRYDTAQAERETLEFLARHVPANTSPMCGNTICQDRRFLYRHMRELERYFHYRHLDVSTVKELARRWAPDLPGYPKGSSHLAMDDILDSIKELGYYRKHVFRV